MKEIGPILLVMLAAVAAGGQMRTFTYDLRGCKFRATYDSKKFAQRNLRDTVTLMESAGIPLETNATPFTLAELSKLDVAKLDVEYQRVLAKLNSLQVVPSPYFRDLKQQRLTTLDRYYHLSRASVLAYNNPESLKAIDWAPECSTRYARPLISGGDELLAAWLDVNAQSRTKNSDPARVQRTYEEQYASPDRMKYAQLEVMAFGWWNCANQKIQYSDDYDEQERQFKKVFKTIKQVECYDI